MSVLKRACISLFGTLIIGIGIGLFKQSALGTDACTAFNIILGERLGISLGATSLLMNCLYLTVPLFLARKYIHIGTLYSVVLTGYVIQFASEALAAVFPAPAALLSQLFWLLPAVLVISFGIALYQKADLGIGPYDSLPLILSERTKIPYFAARIGLDMLCALTAYLLGRTVGIGTVLCALFLGPFIQFFSRLLPL